MLTAIARTVGTTIIISGTLGGKELPDVDLWPAADQVVLRCVTADGTPVIDGAVTAFDATAKTFEYIGPALATAYDEPLQLQVWVTFDDGQVFAFPDGRACRLTVIQGTAPRS